MVESTTTAPGGSGPSKSSLWDGASAIFCCAKYFLCDVQLPIRNFYARCFIMFVYFSKIKDLMPNTIPGYNPTFEAVKDTYTGKDINNFDAIRMNQMQITPDASNRIHEGILWKWRQPGFMRDVPEMWIGTYFPWVMGAKKERFVAWVTASLSVGRHFQHAAGEAGRSLAQGLHDGQLHCLIASNESRLSL